MKKWYGIMLLFLIVQCREPYNITPAGNSSGLLVVEGVLNANGITKVSVSRTTPLSALRISPETGATLLIESEADGETYPFAETSNGIYESSNNLLDVNKKYRLLILTSDNKQYASEFKQMLVTPPIDSLSWRQENGGVQIYLNGHNDADNTPYYKWDYEETWEFHSTYRATLGFKRVPPDADGNEWQLTYLDPVTESVDLSLFQCYNSRSSSSINIGSTAALSSNVLLFPVRFVVGGSIELSVLYSIKVNQYALSDAGYDFFTRMKKNTEQLGSIFDSQPSELRGNIKCLTDTSEIVIGYIENSTLSSQRMFIDNADLPEWGYSQGCVKWFDSRGYPYQNDPSLFQDIIDRGLHPTIPIETDIGAVKTFEAEPEACVDCRIFGSSVKPDFWP